MSRRRRVDACKFTVAIYMSVHVLPLEIMRVTCMVLSYQGPTRTLPRHHRSPPSARPPTHPRAPSIPAHTAASGMDSPLMPAPAALTNAMYVILASAATQQHPHTTRVVTLILGCVPPHAPRSPPGRPCQLDAQKSMTSKRGVQGMQ
jgi:hypothetical protein